MHHRELEPECCKRGMSKQLIQFNEDFLNDPDTYSKTIQHYYKSLSFVNLCWEISLDLAPSSAGYIKCFRDDHI